ncbi:hypothetical protein [Aeromicrobium sp. UC242_57]|uniref:hypothetical protein n=1 Tax=Aeromicrobium sp. UC242_57 TaxID=3374624 RepID=UPI0037BEE00F
MRASRQMPYRPEIRANSWNAGSSASPTRVRGSRLTTSRARTLIAQTMAACSQVGHGTSNLSPGRQPPADRPAAPLVVLGYAHAMTATFRLGYKNILGSNWTPVRHRWPGRAVLLDRG